MSPAASQHFTRGLRYFEQGKYTEAIQSFQHALVQQPSFPPANYYLATLYVKLGHAGKAISYYKNAIQYAPNLAKAHYGLASAHRELKEFDQAVSEYQKVVDIKLDYSDAHYNLAQAYIKLGKREAAEKAMEFFETLRPTDPLLAKAQQWVKAYPDNAKRYNNLGIIYASRRRYDLAVENYKKAIALSPNLAIAYYNLGLVYGKLDQYNLAIESYKQAIRHDSQLAIAHNNLAVHYAEQGIRLNEALKHAKTAVELTPEDPNYLDTLAWMYFKKQMYPEAERVIRKAIELAPSEESYLKRLNEVLNAQQFN